MPMSRNYGGYSSYSYQPAASVYGTSYTNYGRGGSGYRRGSTPAPADGGDDAATGGRPSYALGGSSGLYGAAYVALAGVSNSGYKYLTRNLPDDDDEGIKTINTDELDVETDRGVERRHAIPGAIRRDTAVDLGDRSKQVVRMVTAKQKTYGKGDDSGKELTLGQRLALKHLLTDPAKDGEKKSASQQHKPIIRRSSLVHMTTPRVAKLVDRQEEKQDESDRGESSDDWTWETCSSSEEIGPDVQYFPPTPPSEKKTYDKSSSTSPYGRAKTTNLSEALTRLEDAKTNCPKAKPKALDNDNASRQSLDRWSRAMFTGQRTKKASGGSSSNKSVSIISDDRKPPLPPSAARPATPTKPSTIVTTPTSVCKSVAPEQDLPPPQVKMETEPNSSPSDTIKPAVTDVPSVASKMSMLSVPLRRDLSPTRRSSVSSNHSEDSSENTPKFAGVYKCPGYSSDDEDDEATFSRGWRRGQPPRSDVVVKITAKPADKEMGSQKKEPKAKNTATAPYSHSVAMNKLLTAAVDMSISSSPEDKATPADKAKLVPMPISFEDRTEKLATMRTVKREQQQQPQLETSVVTVKDPSPPPKILQEVKVSKIVENVPVVETVIEPRVDEGPPEEIRLEIVEHKRSVTKKKKGSVVKVKIVKSEVGGEDGEDGGGVVAAKMEFSVKRTSSEEEDEEVVAVVKDTLKDVVSRVVDDEKQECEAKEKKEMDEATVVDQTGSKVIDLIDVDVVEEKKSDEQVPSEASPVVFLPRYLSLQAEEIRVVDVSVSSSGVIERSSLDAGQDMVEARKVVLKVKVEDSKKPVLNDLKAPAVAAATATAATETSDKKPQQPQPQVKKKVKKLKQDAKQPENKVKKAKYQTAKEEQLKLAKIPKVTCTEADEGMKRDSSSPETPLSTTQLERLPSPMRKFFEWKSRAASGELVRQESPKEKPKYWDNNPTPCDPTLNPMLQMAKMREDYRKHQEHVKEEQEAILKTATDAEEPWYDEEPDGIREQLKEYQRPPSNHHKPAGERRTPEENMAIVKLYGGAQFPQGDPGDTPTPCRLLLGGQGKANGVVKGTVTVQYIRLCDQQAHSFNVSISIVSSVTFKCLPPAANVILSSNVTGKFESDAHMHLLVFEGATQFAQ